MGLSLLFFGFPNEIVNDQHSDADAPFLSDAFSEDAISEVTKEYYADPPRRIAWYTEWAEPKRFAAALTVAVVSTTAVVWPPQAPTAQATATPTELWFPKWQEPLAHLVPRRSVALLGDQAIFHPRVPETEFQDGWRSRFTDPPKAAARSIELLGDTTIWSPRVPDREYQEGWRSRFTDPPQYLVARRTAVLGTTSVPAPRVPDVEYQDGWRSRFTDPPQHLQARRTVDLLGNITDMPPRTPDTEFQDGWRQEFSKPIRLTPQPRLEGYVAWPGVGYSFVQAATPSEFWFPRWGEPPKTAPRSVDLLSSIAWDPQFQVAVGTPSELGFRTQFNDPPKAAPRSVDLLSGIEWPNRTPEVEYQDGWRSRFTDPPKLAPRSVDLLGKPVWAARVADVEFQDGWRSRFTEPPKLAPRSVELLGDSTILAPRVPDVEYQDGWRNLWQGPPANLQARRSVDLLSGWSYQALNFAANVATVTTEMWHERWPRPMWAAPRSIMLLGNDGIMPPRVPDREFQDGWRSRFTDPPAHLRPRRSVDLLTGWDWLPRVADREFQDGWRNLWQGPPANLKPLPRLAGRIAWAPQVIAAAAFNNFEAAWTFKWPNPPPPIRSVASTGVPVWPGIGFATPPNLVCAFLPVQDPNWTIEVGFSVAPPVLTLGAFDVPVDDSMFELLVASFSFDLPVGCRQGCNCPNCNC